MAEETTPLAEHACVPCRGGIPPMDRAEALALLAELPGWTIDQDARALQRAWRLKDFAAAFALVQEIAALAEAEGHHPDLCFGWGRVEVSLTTKKIRGLHANDFVMAAKIGRLAARATGAA